MNTPCHHKLKLLFGLIILDFVLLSGIAGAQRTEANSDRQKNQREAESRKPPGVGCGRSFSLIPKIVGGDDAAFGANPWQAALFVKNWVSAGPFCGGALIHPEFVLTAAHCVDDERPSNMIVRLGEHDWKDDREWLPHEDHAIKEIMVHEGYSASSTSHDIALIRMSRLVELSHSKWHINTICLPTRHARFVGRTAKVSGWGFKELDLDIRNYYTPSVLQEANVQILQNSACRAAWNSKTEEEGEELEEDSWEGEGDVHFGAGMLCAGRKAGGRGFCDGDSGGPLSIIGENGRAQLIGVVAFSACGDKKYPEAYMSVSDHLDWIEENMDDI